MASLCVYLTQLVWLVIKDVYKVVCGDCGKTLVITNPLMVQTAKMSKVTARCRKDKCNAKADLHKARYGD